MKMYFKKVKHRLMFWFLLITLIPILVIVAFSYHQQVAELKANTYIKLEAIRDLKADQLKRWLEERFADQP
jgi:hypothetical protein